MNKATRTLAVTGMALIAGLTLGVGPAAAASSTTTTAATTKQATHQADRGRLYPSLRQCLWAGRIGERRGRWDSYDCNRVRWGSYRGWWELDVEWDHDGWPGGGHHGGPGGHDGPWDGGHDGPWDGGHDRPWDGGHDGPGHDGPGHGGHDGPGHGWPRR